MKNLEERLEVLESRLKALETPKKFKVGDIVYLHYHGTLKRYEVTYSIWCGTHWRYSLDQGGEFFGEAEEKELIPASEIEKICNQKTK